MSHNNILYSSLVVTTIIFSLTCGNQTIDFSSFPKIDAHVHLRTFAPAFVEQAMEDNFQLFKICTRASSQAYIDEQFKFATYQKENFSNTVSFATTFSMEDWDTPDWQTKIIEGLKKYFAKGAIAVKVWKDIGMTFRDSEGNFIMIDEPSFDPILDLIACEGKTLIAHCGEPKNCYLPLDSMTANNDREYLNRANIID